MKDHVKRIYCIAFFILLLLPLIFINRDEEAISEKENRPLAHFPNLFVYDKLNPNFPKAMDEYLNDRIGFREMLISCNGLIQYHVFGRMEDSDRYRLGPDGEFNIIEEEVVETYQHKNLYSDSEVQDIVSSFQEVNDYLADRGTDLYYLMCYDKSTIYPEYFPDSVNQYGDISNTDQIINALENDTDVIVVPAKQNYMALRDEYELYSKYGDPVHWTQRGAYLGYSLLMDTINANDPDTDYPVLQESDFDISITDQGMEFYGGVKRSNMSEDFVLKHSSSVYHDNATDGGSSFEGYKAYYYTNENAGNNKKCLVICNSFVINYIRDWIAESFGETMFVWTGMDPELIEWVSDFDPDVVIYESAERYEYFEGIQDTADMLK